mmetsp:Transcript_44275/g.93023  ORF Transcript_44275/g.93023 Transcript_44275/m.93023 type:complete len:438 (+) Transcript_44275:1393-2706(+)
MVHVQTPSVGQDDRHGVQGIGRDQHRRPLPRPGCVEPPRRSVARVGHAQEPASGHRSRERRSRGTSRSNGRIVREGPSVGLRRRRRGHGVLEEIGGQFGRLVHGPRDTVRSQHQARRGLHRREDRSHIFQHHGRFGRVARRNGRSSVGNGGCRRHLSARGQGCQSRVRQGGGDVRAQDQRTVGRGPRRRAHTLDHRPRSRYQGARGIGSQCRRERRLRHPRGSIRDRRRCGTPRFAKGIHARAKDRRQSLQQRVRNPSGSILRTPRDHRGESGHHRPDDARRAPIPGLYGIHRRLGNAVVLSYRRISQTDRFGNARDPSGLCDVPRWREFETGGRRDTRVVESYAPPRHGRHRGRFSHPLPVGDFFPGRFGARRVCGGYGNVAPGYARIDPGEVHGRNATWYYVAGFGTVHSLHCHPKRIVDGRYEWKKECIFGTHY